MLGKELAELISIIRKEKAVALSFNSAIETNLHIAYLIQTGLGLYTQSQCVCPRIHRLSQSGDRPAPWSGPRHR